MIRDKHFLKDYILYPSVKLRYSKKTFIICDSYIFMNNVLTPESVQLGLREWDSVPLIHDWYCSDQDEDGSDEMNDVRPRDR